MIYALKLIKHLEWNIKKGEKSKWN